MDSSFLALAVLVTACSVDSGVRRRTVLDPSDPAAPTSPAPPPPPSSSSSPAPVASGAYTCPMHADVVRDAPGQCPVCGMTLAPGGGGK